MQPKATACVHLCPAPRRDGASRGAGRVSSAASCATVIGEGNQLNPRAGGQATRQARQTGLNEWETVNNVLEEAVVNKIPALQVRVLPAVGKGKRGTPRRATGRDESPSQPRGRHLLPLIPPRLPEQPGITALTLRPSIRHHGSPVTSTGTTSRLPGQPPSLPPAHRPLSASPRLTMPQPHSPTSPPAHLTALMPQLHRLAKHHLCFPSPPSSRHLCPRGQSPPCLISKCFSNTQSPPSLLPSLHRLRGAIRGEARVEENE